MSVDITRAPYRQSGNVVRDSSILGSEDGCLLIFVDIKCCFYRFYQAFKVFLDLSNSIGNSRRRREVTSAGAPRKTVIRASKCEVYCVVVAPNCHFSILRKNAWSNCDEKFASIKVEEGSN